MPLSRSTVKGTEAKPLRSVHRHPGEESIDLYPGLVVSDGQHSRVTGSITAGRSRLPLWAFMGQAIQFGWDEEVAYNYEPEEYGWTKEQAAAFIHHLMELRGEFGRLLLVLADAERCEANGGRRPWWSTKRHRKRVADQLRRCLEVLEDR